MAVGDIISATDYNTIRNRVVGVLGNGSASRGYGQALNSAGVSTGTTITKTQWDQLRYDLYNVLVHQTGSTPSLVSVNVGDPIRFGSAYPNNQYDTQSSTADTNRFNVGSGQYITNSSVYTASTTSAWTAYAYCDVTCTFASSDQARHFFNSGGQIRVVTSRSGGTAKDQNTQWTNVLNSAGTQVFGGQLPQTGFSPMDGKNFYRLTNAFQDYYSLAASGAYSSNTYKLQAKCDVANNSGGTARIVYIRIYLVDPYTDPPNTGDLAGSYPPEDGVDGTLVTTVSELKASGVLQPSPTMGNFTITSPTYTGTGWVVA